MNAEETGLHCAQSVPGAFCAEEGFDLDTARKLANGFGGRYAVRRGVLRGFGRVAGHRHEVGFQVERDLRQKGL